MDDVELEFRQESLEAIVDKAIERKTGARGLRSIIEEIMRDIMFEIPSNPNIEKLTTQYYETFAITGKFTGYFSNITIGDFYNNLSSKYCDPTAILGGLNSTARKKEDEKEKSTFNIVANNNYYCSVICLYRNSKKNKCIKCG